MNKMIATLIGSVALVGTPVGFAQAKGFYDTARVVDADPIYETLDIATPEEHCWTESARTHESDRRDQRVGAITGAIVGGIVGHQFGQGHGKDA